KEGIRNRNVTGVQKCALPSLTQDLSQRRNGRNSPERKKPKSLPSGNGGRKRRNRVLLKIRPLLRGPASRMMHLPRKRRPSRICPAPLPPLLLGKRNGKRNGSQRFVSINPSIPPPGGASAGRPEKIFGS